MSLIIENESEKLHANLEKSLKNLNKKQKEAVLNTDGVILIVAGPGSGKTMILTTKIAYLICEKGINPNNILALTFTNKAANEMKTRINNYTDINLDNLYIGTFHSCFYKILRENYEKIGYSKNFTIYDTVDSKDLIDRIITDFKYNPEQYNKSTIFARISLMKNNSVTSSEYSKNKEFLEYDKQKQIGEFYKIFSEYERRCIESNVMDFDDILIYTYKLFLQNPEILKKYQDKFKYIFVDEFQDTNTIQYNILKILSSGCGNICVVGDDSQSIYSFRGACIQNILKFKDDYKNCKLIKLEQNYRSTNNIVSVSNLLISKNSEKINKTIWTGNNDGEKIKVIHANTNLEETKFISVIIKNNINHGLYKPSDIAILYRKNDQIKQLETELQHANLKYKIVGGTSFYEKAIIKDIIAFFRVIINRNDVEAIKRTINKPRRGIGDTTLKKVYSFVNIKTKNSSEENNSKNKNKKKTNVEKNKDNSEDVELVSANKNTKNDNSENIEMNLWYVLLNANLFFVPRIAGLLQRYVSLISELTDLASKTNAYKLAKELIDKAGFIEDNNKIKHKKSNKEDESDDDDDDLIKDLLNSIKIFVDSRKEGEDKSLIAYMQNLQLNNVDVENNNEKSDNNAISLMTVHSAKGLEFKCVFIVGLEEGVFPLLYENKQANIEEERRLFYVALTRAKEKVYLSYSSMKYIYGKRQNTEKSRFLDEIKSEFVDDNEISLNKLKNGQSNKKNDYASYSMFKYSIVSRKINEGNSVVKGEIKAGVNVYHSMYGYGKIVNIDGASNNLIRAKFERFEEEKTLEKNISNLFVFSE